MTMKNIQCSLAGLGRMTVLRAQVWHGFGSVAGSGCRGLREDDGVVDPVGGWHRSLESWAQKRRGVHSVIGLGRMTLFRGRERHRGLGDGEDGSA
jgi:hypothetical protein